MSNNDGAIVITLILYFPKSLAIGKVIPIRAPLEAEYARNPLWPSNPKTLETLIMTPLSPLIYSCSDMTLAAYFETFKVPITLILRIFSITLEDKRPFEEIMDPVNEMPAELTTT